MTQSSPENATFAHVCNTKISRKWGYVPLLTGYFIPPVLVASWGYPHDATRISRIEGVPYARRTGF